MTAPQSEYSLWWREPEQALLPRLQKLGISVVPYRPLGKGLLTGTISTDTTFSQSDFRRQVPRLSSESIDANSALIPLLTNIAKARGAPPRQIALVWLLSRSPWIVPIPGNIGCKKTLPRLK